MKETFLFLFVAFLQIAKQPRSFVKDMVNFPFRAYAESKENPPPPPPPCLTLLLIYLWSLSGCDSKQCLFFPGNHLLQACFRMYPGFQSAGCLSSLCSQFPSLKLRQTHPGIFCLGFSTRSNFPLLTPPSPPPPWESHPFW